MGVLSGKTIVFGITGGIAAYKAAEVCSGLVKSGADVHVVMTRNSRRFVGKVTFAALTGNTVITDMWVEPTERDIEHVSLSDRADLVLIAPATANIIGKIASGVSDDMLSTLVCATAAPVIIAPAMNCRMWRNRVTQANVERLKSIGYEFVGPDTGRLACGEDDVGRLAPPDEIVKAVVERLSRGKDLAGVSVLVTAGPTREALDPVRFISNRSSGKMGYAVAEAAAERGASVVMVSGPTALDAPKGVEVVRVETAAEMLAAVMERLPGARVIIGAAAVADYRPESFSVEKVKKTGGALKLNLAPTVDIMAEIGKSKGGRVLVIFAAETERLVENAKKKLASKNADLVVANDVSNRGIGFDSDFNEVTILDAKGGESKVPRESKRGIANRIIDRVVDILQEV